MLLTAAKNDVTVVQAECVAVLRKIAGRGYPAVRQTNRRQTTLTRLVTATADAARREAAEASQGHSASQPSGLGLDA